MFVCICRAVSDRALDEAIAGGAHTLEAVRRATGAGTSCGSCLPAIALALRRAGHTAIGSLGPGSPPSLGAPPDKEPSA